MAGEESREAAVKGAQVAFEGLQLDSAAKERVQNALHEALATELSRGGGNPAAFFGSSSVMGLNAVEQLGSRLGQLSRGGLNQPGQ